MEIKKLELNKRLIPEIDLVKLWKIIKKIVGYKIDLNELALLKTEDCNLHSQKIDEGRTCKVYLLENKDKTKRSYAIKVTVASAFGNLDDVHSIAKKYKEDFEFLQDCYGEGIILDEVSYISKINSNGRIGIITVQEFMGFDIYDVFEDISERKLVQILKNDEKLREKFILFVNKTVELREKQGKLIDLFGGENLVLYLDEQGKYDLKFIDPHNIQEVDKTSRYFATVYYENERYLQKIVKIIQ